MGEEVEELVEVIEGEAVLLDAHSASWLVHLPPLLRRASAEIKKLRAILSAVMDVEKAEPTGDPHDPASWASSARSVVAGSEHERVCAERDSLRASLTRAEEESAWQPIETAPKDGTWILVYEDAGFEPKHHVVHWGRPEWGGGDDTWVTMALGPNPDTYDPTPQHWRPLPHPPVISRDSASTGKAAPE